MQSRNPVLGGERFRAQTAVGSGEPMTMSGAAWKTVALLILACVTGTWTWHRFSTALAAAYQSLPLSTENPAAAAAAQAMGSVSLFLWGGLIAGLILAFATIFKPRWSPISAPLYAIAEGFALGGISAFMERMYPGVVMQAIMLTGGVLAVMLISWRAGWIKVTKKFRSMVTIATGGILLVYLLDMGLRFFGGINIPFIHESGAMGIGFSLLVVGLAALNLVLDFDLIEKGAAGGAAKYMEWYGAFALMVTLVWLYLELLRLLTKLRD